MSENISSIFEEKYCCDSMPERIARDYETLSCLKYTESRKVYLLRHMTSGARMILKCGVGQSGELLHNEYKISKELFSAGIECRALPRAVDYFFEGDVHYYIREYVEGRTLAYYVERNGAFGQAEAYRVMSELCSAIHQLHSCKPAIICRDINPDNVLIRTDGSVCIVDLDSARRYNPSATSDTIWVGTKEMAAPEQFGFTQTNTRTDIYVLGMLLLYITTGSYDKFSRIPSRLKKVIDKSTAFNPDERYATVMDMRRALLRKPRAPIIAAAAVLVLLVLLLSAVPFITAYHHIKAEISQGSAPSEHIGVRTSATTDVTSTPAVTTTTPATAAPPQSTVTTTTTTPITTTETTPVTTTSAAQTTTAATTTTPHTTSAATTTTTAATTTTTAAPATVRTTASERFSVPEEIPADGKWHMGADGAFYFIHENKEDPVNPLEIDTSHITDWSKIRTIYADVVSIGGNSDMFLYTIVNGQHNTSDSIGGKNNTWTLHIDTNGENIQIVALRAWWAEANTVIKVSNIVFSEEEYTPPEYGVWRTNSDGSYTYKQGDFNGSGDTTPALEDLIPEEGLAEDWSKIYALSADIEVTGGDAWLLTRGDLDGSYALGIDKTFKNESGTIMYVTDGKKLGNNGFDIMCWHISPNTEIKVSNIRYIMK